MREYQINKISNENRDIAIDIKKIHRIIRIYFKSQYYTKLENSKEIDNLLDIYYLPKLSQYQINSFKRTKTPNETQGVNKDFQPQKV